MMKKENMTDRVVAKFKSLVFDTDLCIEWKDGKDKDGYGRQSTNISGRLWTYKAHRIAYAIFNVEVDDNICVLHSCDNPSCINPKHLFLGSNVDNTKDCQKKGRNVGHIFSKKEFELGAKNRRVASKLSDSDIESIHSMYEKGVVGKGFKALGKLFGVSPSAICLIIQNKIRIAS